MPDIYLFFYFYFLFILRFNVGLAYIKTNANILYFVSFLNVNKACFKNFSVKFLEHLYNLSLHLYNLNSLNEFEFLFKYFNSVFINLYGLREYGIKSLFGRDK